VGVAAALVVASTAVWLTLPGRGGSRTVVVAGNPTTTVSANCRGGGPPQEGQARVGLKVSFTTLPKGYSLVDSFVDVAAPSQLAAPGGRPSSSQRISVVAQPVDADTHPTNLFRPSPPTTPTVVQGHPATLGAPAAGLPGQVAVLWSPDPGVTIRMTASGLPAATVVAVAQHVSYRPGTTAPSVGDLGPVLPRTEILATYTTKASHVRTWLISAPEWARARASTGVGGSLLNQYHDPMWVVVVSSVPEQYFVIDAITGFSLEVGTLNAPSFLADLVDHQSFPPCPVNG
jgi:hypothetical protein